MSSHTTVKRHAQRENPSKAAGSGQEGSKSLTAHKGQPELQSQVGTRNSEILSQKADTGLEDDLAGEVLPARTRV